MARLVPLVPPVPLVPLVMQLVPLVPPQLGPWAQSAREQERRMARLAQGHPTAR